MTSPLPVVNHLVIIAGGQGVRLAPVAPQIPKAMVAIGGKPVLQHQLELAAAAGIEEVTILAGHLAAPIADFIGDGSRFGLQVRISVEQEPMGNAGAFLQILDSLPEHCFVLYGDVMLSVDLRRLGTRHLQREADITLFAHPNDHPHDSDLLETDASDWLTAIHPYPHAPDRFFGNLVNAGLFVVRREALRPWAGAAGKREFTRDLIAGLLASGGRILAYRSSEYIKDMGTPARHRRVEADWQAGKISLAEGGRKRSAVFLDRDGTLNVENGHLGSAAGLKLLPGVGSALRSLRQAGYYLVVVTNQPVIARGEATEADVAAIHRRLEWELGKEGAYLDAIYLCPHHPDGGYPGERAELKTRCECRKPGLGLFERACHDFPIDTKSSWMIGDHARDIEFARAAGLRSVQVTTGPAAPGDVSPSVPDYVAGDLVAACDLILRHTEPSVQ